MNSQAVCHCDVAGHRRLCRRESTRLPKWLVGAALHAATAIAIVVVSAGVMPRVLDTTAAGWAVVAFLAGAIFSVLLARGVEYGRERVFGGPGSRGAWMVYVAAAADLA